MQRSWTFPKSSSREIIPPVVLLSLSGGGGGFCTVFAGSAALVFGECAQEFVVALEGDVSL